MACGLPWVASYQFSRACRAKRSTPSMRERKASLSSMVNGSTASRFTPRVAGEAIRGTDYLLRSADKPNVTSAHEVLEECGLVAVVVIDA